MIKSILTDIEGTTSSLAFIRDELAPYSYLHLRRFWEQHREDPEIKRLLADIRAYAGRELADEALLTRMLAWIEADQRITPLKALEALIWEEGYRCGDLQGHIYADAARNLQAWHRQGVALYVFSSGSVHGQGLLFRHTPFGDLRRLFREHFDTRIGGKKDVGAYKSILMHTAANPEEMLFISAGCKELDAAASTGMQTVAIARDPQAGPFGSHRVIQSFDELDLSD